MFKSSELAHLLGASLSTEANFINKVSMKVCDSFSQLYQSRIGVTRPVESARPSAGDEVETFVEIRRNIFGFNDHA